MDYQSPSSAGLHSLLERFVEEHQDTVTRVVRDVPIETSIDAFGAAEAAEAALDSQKCAEHIERDIEDARKYGVTATPVVFVNGRRLDENGPADLQTILKAIVEVR